LPAEDASKVGLVGCAAAEVKLAAEDMTATSGKDESEGNRLVFTGEETGLEFTTIVVLFISQGVFTAVDVGAEAEAEENSTDCDLKDSEHSDFS
jgi:hypothetical protein